MRSIFQYAVVAGVVALGYSAAAQTVAENFESGTNGANLPTVWLPGTSGTSTGNYTGTPTGTYSNEQAHGGTLSGKLGWTWIATSTNAPKRMRIQPAATFASAALANRTSTPYVGFYLYGAAQGDEVALYMGEGANGATPYEAFAYHPITWNGWQIIEHNISDPVTGYLTGDGTLNATCSLSGLAFNPPTANPGTTAAVTYYVDDFAYSATPRGTSAVSNWSVY